MESSILEVYRRGIENSQHFIYIENQFFMSRNAWCDALSNDIMECLGRRIASAIEEDVAFASDPTFFVAIVLPVQPDAQVTDWSTKGHLHHEYQTIQHLMISTRRVLVQMHAIASSLKGTPAPTAARIDELLERYLGVYALWNHGTVATRTAGGPIYVHDKMMIVDDRVAIIGSANLFDRSLLGDGDSEIAAVVIDDAIVEGQMGGEDVSLRAFARNLRIDLWREHLGASAAEDLGDAVKCYTSTWIPRAAANTTSYLAAFPDMPRAGACTPEMKPWDAKMLSRGEIRPPTNVESGMWRFVRNAGDRIVLRDAGVHSDGDWFLIPNLWVPTKGQASESLPAASGATGTRGHLIRFPLHAFEMSHNDILRITR